MSRKILIIGCGSIGIRHLRILKSLGIKKVFALRTRRGHCKDLPSDIRCFVDEIFSDSEVVALKPSHIIISNPTNLHLRYIQIFANSNAKIFIEKPLSDTLRSMKRIKEPILNKIKVNKAMIGFHLRFHPLFKKIKTLVESKKLGKVVSANLSVGFYLPFWHPYEDYRQSYAARKDMGGGVLRTLSHELDMAVFLFGKVTKVQATIEKLSNLDIDVDDWVDISLTTKKCKRVVVHLDYLRPCLKRSGEIFFEKGLVEYDYSTGLVQLTTYLNKSKKTIYRAPKTYDYNAPYRDQMKNFLSNKDIAGCTFKEGLENLALIEACEQSQKKRSSICLA